MSSGNSRAFIINQKIIPLEGAELRYWPALSVHNSFGIRAGNVWLGRSGEVVRGAYRINVIDLPWSVATAENPISAIADICAYLVVRHGISIKRVEDMLLRLVLVEHDQPTNAKAQPPTDI